MRLCTMVHGAACSKAKVTKRGLVVLKKYQWYNTNGTNGTFFPYRCSTQTKVNSSLRENALHNVI